MASCDADSCRFSAAPSSGAPAPSRHHLAFVLVLVSSFPPVRFVVADLTNPPFSRGHSCLSVAVWLPSSVLQFAASPLGCLVRSVDSVSARTVASSSPSASNRPWGGRFEQPFIDPLRQETQLAPASYTRSSKSFGMHLAVDRLDAAACALRGFLYREPRTCVRAS